MMRYHVIADEDTVLGFRFAGLEGDVVETPAQAREVFERVRQDETVGVIIMTEQSAASIGEEVERAIFESTRPIIVRIPGPEGPAPDRRTLQRIIEETVGIKL